MVSKKKQASNSTTSKAFNAATSNRTYLSCSALSTSFSPQYHQSETWCHIDIHTAAHVDIDAAVSIEINSAVNIEINSAANIDIIAAAVIDKKATASI